VNTGWTGGPYGTGERISITHTRAIISAITNGSLNVIPTTQHPVFDLAVPNFCPGAPDETLDPKQTWDDTAAYDTAGFELRDTFRDRAMEQGITDELTGWLRRYTACINAVPLYIHEAQASQKAVSPSGVEGSRHRIG